MKSPTIINFMGAPGVGKTTLAQQISQQTGIYFFQREVLMDNIFGNERDTLRYKQIADHITKSMYELATCNAKTGISCITEGTLKPVIQGNRTEFLDAMLEASTKHNFNVAVVYCTAPAESILAHLKQRAAPRDEQKYNAGWQEFLKTFINVPGPTLYEHLRIDTTLPVDINIEKIIEYLKR